MFEVVWTLRSETLYVRKLGSGIRCSNSVRTFEPQVRTLDLKFERRLETRGL